MSIVQLRAASKPIIKLKVMPGRPGPEGAKGDPGNDGADGEGDIFADRNGLSVSAGASDNSAAVAALETAHLGEPVNLRNEVFLVSELPTGANYYNGAFKVGSDTIWLPREPRNHPFEGPNCSIKFVDPIRHKYRGLNTGLFQASADGVLVSAWREARGHGIEVGTRLMVGRSDDGLNSFLEEPYLIFTQSDCDTRNFTFGTIDGRFVILAARVKADASHYDPILIYSDGDGAPGTWTSVPVTGLTAATMNFHSKLTPYPASAGGHDTDGAVALFYHGATWTEHANAIVPTVTFPSISETSIARVGSQNKWIATIRTNGNVGISRSSNLTTWSTVIDSGLLLDANPPELIYDDGKIHLLAPSRRDKPLIPGVPENSICIASADGDTVYNSSGALGWQGWKLVTTAPFWPTGYFATMKVREKWYALGNAEDYAGSTQSRTSNLILLSPDLIATASLPAIAKMIPNPNLTPNGGLRQWTHGTSFVTTSRAVVADGFTFARSSSVAGATVSRVAGDKAEWAMRIVRDDGNSAVQAMNLVANILRSDSIPLRSQQVTLSFRARKLSGFSAVNSFLTAQLRQTNHTSEQAITSSGGTYVTGDAAVGSSSGGVTLTEDWQTFKYTPGKLNDDTTQLSIRFLYTPVGTASSDGFEIELIKVEIGADRTPFVYDPTHIEQARCQRFVQTGSVRSANGYIPVYFSPKMHLAPTVTVSAGTASEITTSGFKLAHTSEATVTWEAVVIF
jgi:hypothetical protein